jgi:membrane protein YdbS with pleckstrin-like domain
MNNFTNSIILPDDLPEIENKAFNPLDKKYLTLSLIRLAIVLVFIVGGFVAFLIFAEHNLPRAVLTGIFIVLAAIFLYVFAISLIGFPRKGYLVRENDISF